MAVAKRGASSALSCSKKSSRGEHGEPLVSEDPQIELAAVDVLLDEGVALEALVQKARALERFRLVLGERRARDPVAGLFADRFDEDGIREKALQVPQRPLARRDNETRHADAMKRQELLGESLVLAKHQRVGTGARVRHLHQLEQRGDVRLVRPVREEGLAQVEDDVRLEHFDLVEDRLHGVVDGERLDLVSEFAQAVEHVGFRGLLFLASKRAHTEGLVRPDRAVHVEEHENTHQTDLLKRPV